MAMGVQQTILWISMSVMTGVTCLGATEPQPSKVEPVTSSVEASRGVEWRTVVMSLAGPFTMGSDDGPQNE
jgi:hypothetical protein